ncbi:MAG TPA: UvrD-helicase domain-containing protein [Burkholderiales bacterium]|nr:UvrD-helicase domain-containing protein [Burkholderiales bacterium]
MTLTAKDIDLIDAPADDTIAQCLSSSGLRSFFLFAGAGSGKTRSLVTALKHVQKELGRRLKLRGQRVAVITFTNAASDEIKRRLLFDPLIDVRTIHSFCWSLIDGLDHDIREWLRISLGEDIKQLRLDEAKGRKGSAASIRRLGQIESKTKRLARLDTIKRFVYSPVGDNREREALNHAQVIQLTAHFLSTKPVMQSILAGRYPILLIDESQDTNQHLVDALFKVERAQRDGFVLGLIGDMMQRIYNEGKEGLGQNLPPSWATPGKKLNHRCPRRVVKLINKVRETADLHQQEPRPDAPEGVVRLFIFPSAVQDKPACERKVAVVMQELTGDRHWEETSSVKTLTLEHRMAAARMGFTDVFVPLYEVESWRTSFLEGKLPAIRFFSEDVLPLLKAAQSSDRFAVARIAKEKSPLLSPDALRAARDQQEHLRRVNDAISSMLLLWKDGRDPTLLEVLRYIKGCDLLTVPEILEPNAGQAYETSTSEVEGDSDQQSLREAAIERFLNAPFSQIEPMANYLASKAHFDTHQGVKGLEFERVMVIMDDEEARGFTFKYEDLFGGKEPGSRTVEATKRLFYVTCSRAKGSLALVAYSQSPDRVRAFVTKNGWFTPDEVLMHIGS